MSKMGRPLSDVHTVLPLPPQCSDFATVRGKYEFYHYQVDGFDDRGWGCGYRTLQTLCSWCEHALQRTVSPHKPNLRDIQHALVQTGDKPESFVGSCQWIGSFEACLCLEFMYDIQSKIIHVSSGSQVKDKAPEILGHFRKLGSPVMIGGDNDASSKTLLGVCKTAPGDFYFLIADPHYVGADDVQTLQRDQWIQWKCSQDAFVSNSFYNFCLPQLRPSSSKTTD